MKVRVALTVAMIFAAVAQTAQAQTPTDGTQPKPAAQHQPATRVQPAQGPASAQTAAARKVDPAQDAAIRHLLDITDQSKIADHISGAISMQVRSIMGRNLPEERLQSFMLDFDLKLHNKVSPNQIEDLVVAIYAQYFSADDIQGLVKFYESPLGQRIVKTMPQVVQDSQDAGLKIERQAGLEALQEMSDEYPELKPMLAAEPKPSTAPAPSLSPAPNQDTPKN
jgi:hypothetical protein